jgi:hypothetical protein
LERGEVEYSTVKTGGLTAFHNFLNASYSRKQTTNRLASYNLSKSGFLGVKSMELKSVMKCVKESPSKRVYQEKVSCPFPFLTFMSLPFLALVWFSPGDHHFTCFRVDQSAVNCEVFFKPLLPLPSTTKLYKDVTSTTKLYKDVRGAGTKTEIETDADGDRTVYYYVTLKTPAGEREAWSASSEREARELARRVQSFVNGTESHLLVYSSKPSVNLIMIFFLFFLWPEIDTLIAAGIFTLILAFWCPRLTFDRSLYQIQEEYLTPFGSRGQKTYSFRDVQQVTVQARTDSDGDTSFSVEVTLQSQKPLLSIFSSSEREARAEAEKLGQFLGCPVIFLRETKS